MSFSTQVKVMPPSLLLSLKRSRKVPGGLVLRMARSRSLLMNPMMYPSFHSARIYFFTKSMMLSSQTQKEKPFPAMFSLQNLAQVI